MAVILIVIKYIPGSFVGTSGNGSVGTSGRFSVTDWKKKKEYYHYVLGKYSVFCSQRKEMLYKTPGIDAS